MPSRDFNECLDFMYTNYQKCPYDYPFDRNSPPDKFGYFEVIMDKEGRIYEAPNGHQRGAILMLARDLGITTEKVERRAVSAGADYIEWIVEKAQVLLIWHRFYIGVPNEKQRASIEDLKNKGHIHHNAMARGTYYGF